MTEQERQEKEKEKEEKEKQAQLQKNQAQKEKEEKEKAEKEKKLKEMTPSSKVTITEYMDYKKMSVRRRAGFLSYTGATKNREMKVSEWDKQWENYCKRPLGR